MLKNIPDQTIGWLAILTPIWFWLARHFNAESGAGCVSRPLNALGLLMAMSGVFSGDFENRTSFTMLLHTIGALGSYFAFLISGFSAPALLRQHSERQAYVWPSTAIVILSIASGFLRSGNSPGLGQRIGFLFFSFGLHWLATDLSEIQNVLHQSHN